MINGAHVIIYSRDAEADRRFLGEVVGLSSVSTISLPGGGRLGVSQPRHPTAHDG